MRLAWATVVLGAIGVVALALTPSGSAPGPLPAAEALTVPSTAMPLLTPSRRTGALFGEALAGLATTTTASPISALPADSAPPAPEAAAAEPTPGADLVALPRRAPAPSDPELVELLYQGVLGRLAPDEQVVDPATEPPPLVGPGIAPLTGLPTDVVLDDRAAVVVKIDNAPGARPQAGLVEADLVYEARVEGGATRFAAVLHSADAAVGPVRSFRSTDIGVLASLDAPMLSWSGANRVFAELLRRQPVVDRGPSRAPYWRDRSRRSPHDLMTDTASLRGDATGSPPPTHFAYRAPGEEPAGGAPVEVWDVGTGRRAVTWWWNGVQWERWTPVGPHASTVGPVITTDNVIVQQVEYVPSGLVDSAGTIVPEAVMVGSGSATVLTAGRTIEATWTRPTLRSVTTFTDGAGEHVALTPGRTWIHLVEG